MFLSATLADCPHVGQRSVQLRKRDGRGRRAFIAFAIAARVIARLVSHCVSRPVDALAGIFHQLQGGAFGVQGDHGPGCTCGQEDDGCAIM